MRLVILQKAIILMLRFSITKNPTYELRRTKKENTRRAYCTG